MSMNYRIIEKEILQVDRNGEQCLIASCDNPQKAVALFDRGHFLNDVKRRYTASARPLQAEWSWWGVWNVITKHDGRFVL